MLRIRCDDQGTVEERMLRLGLAHLMPSPNYATQRAYGLEAGSVVKKGDAKQLTASDEVRNAYPGIA